MDKDLIAELYMKYHGTIREDLERAIQTFAEADEKTLALTHISAEEIEQIEDELGFNLPERVENIAQELSDIKKAIDYNGGVSDMTDFVLMTIDKNNLNQLDGRKSRLMATSQETQAKIHALGKLTKEVIMQFELAAQRGYLREEDAIAPTVSELTMFHDQLKLLELHIEAQRNVVRDDNLPSAHESAIGHDGIDH